MSHDHTDFWPWRPIFAYLTPKLYLFLLHVKFPIDEYVTRTYWFWAPNSVFGGLFLPFWSPKVYFFMLQISGHSHNNEPYLNNLTLYYQCKQLFGFTKGLIHNIHDVIGIKRERAAKFSGKRTNIRLKFW
jgi:hypothetical protein